MADIGDRADAGTGGGHREPGRGRRGPRRRGDRAGRRHGEGVEDFLVSGEEAAKAKAKARKAKVAKDNKAKITALAGTGGPIFNAEVQRVLKGTDYDRESFLIYGADLAKARDEKTAADAKTRADQFRARVQLLANLPDSEVSRAAQTAITAGDAAITAFLNGGYATAAKKDAEAREKYLADQRAKDDAAEELSELARKAARASAARRNLVIAHGDGVQALRRSSNALISAGNEARKAEQILAANTAGNNHPANAYDAVKAEVLRQVGYAEQASAAAAQASARATVEANILVETGLTYGVEWAAIAQGMAEAAQAAQGAATTARHAIDATAATGAARNAEEKAKAHAEKAKKWREYAQEHAKAAAGLAAAAAKQADAAKTAAARTKAARKDAEAAEARAWAAAKRTRDQRVIAENEAAKAAAARQRAEAERAIAASARARAESQAAIARSARGQAEYLAGVARGARENAEAQEGQRQRARSRAEGVETGPPPAPGTGPSRREGQPHRRSQGRRAGGRRRPGRRRHAAVRRRAAAPRPRTEATTARGAATGARSAANTATGAATNARAAATEATPRRRAGPGRREQGRRRRRTGERRRRQRRTRGSDHTPRGDKVERGRPEATVAAGQGRRNRPRRVRLAEDAAQEAAAAFRAAGRTKDEAEAANAESVSAATQATTAVRASNAARQSGSGIADPANTAITIVAPFTGTDLGADFVTEVAEQAKKVGAEQVAAARTGPTRPSRQRPRPPQSRERQRTGQARLRRRSGGGEVRGRCRQVRGRSAAGRGRCRGRRRGGSRRRCEGQPGRRSSPPGRHPGPQRRQQREQRRGHRRPRRQRRRERRGRGPQRRRPGRERRRRGTRRGQRRRSRRHPGRNRRRQRQEERRRRHPGRQERHGRGDRRARSRRPGGSQGSRGRARGAAGGRGEGRDRRNRAQPGGRELRPGRLHGRPGPRQCMKEIRDDMEAANGGILEFLKENGAELLLEVIGWNDLKACFTEGDIEACLWSAASLIPWTKLGPVAKAFFKIASKVGTFLARSAKAKKAVEKIKDLLKLGDKACKLPVKKVAGARVSAAGDPEDAIPLAGCTPGKSVSEVVSEMSQKASKLMTEQYGFASFNDAGKQLWKGANRNKENLKTPEVLALVRQKGMSKDGLEYFRGVLRIHQSAQRGARKSQSPCQGSAEMLAGLSSR